MHSSVTRKPDASPLATPDAPVESLPGGTRRRPSFLVFGFVLVIAFGLLGLLAYGWIQRQAPPPRSGSRAAV